jgi:rhamnosyltransferase
MLYRQHNSDQVGSNFGYNAYIKRIKIINSGWYRSEVEKILEAIDVNGCHSRDLRKWFLIKNFYQLRRKGRDTFILLIASLFGIFF